MPAIYHLSIKIFSRGKGRSAVAAAAYRAAEIIQSEYNGVTHDYTKKTGVVHKEILLPENAPPEYSDRAALWNAAEIAERYKTAQLAREVEISLPRELSREENISLARRFVEDTFVSAGMCVDLCVHDKGDGNPHAHVMLTMRPIEKDGTWGAKSITVDGKKVPTVDWNDRLRAEDWRKAWADAANGYFIQNGSDTRIDHRSYERQGVDQVPTIHMGAAASQMEQRGVRTERGDINREITVTNNEIRQLRARIKKVKIWLYAQPIADPPTMVSIMGHIADAKNLNTRWKKIANIQTQAKVLIFLQQYKVYDMAQLTGAVEKLYDNFHKTAIRIKEVDRRLDTLAQHLAQYDNFKQHKTVYQKYKQLDPKKRDAFHDKHGEKIQLYENANQYLKDVLNGRTEVPINAWKKEHAKLTSERYSLCEDYYRLKDETKSVEVLRRGAESILREEERNQPKRVQGIDL